MASLRATHATDVTNRCNKQTNASIKQTVPKCITLYKGYPLQMTHVLMHLEYHPVLIPLQIALFFVLKVCCTSPAQATRHMSERTHVPGSAITIISTSTLVSGHNFWSESGADIWFQNFCFQIQILDSRVIVILSPVTHCGFTAFPTRLQINRSEILDVIARQGFSGN